MKQSSKNMLTSHLAVISEQLSETNTISQLVNKGLNRLPSLITSHCLRDKALNPLL